VIDPKHSTLRWITATVAVAVTASVLVATPARSGAKDPTPGSPTPGGSTVRPRQDTGTAAGRTNKASANATRADKSTPSGAPALPPSATGVVGPQRMLPDPVDAGAQCRPCPAGTVPVPAPPGAAKREEVQDAKLTTGTMPRGFVAGASRELTGLRTETSTTFANPDGTRTARLYSGPTFALDSRGAMVPIDTTLRRDTDGRYRPAAAKAASFAALGTDPELARLGLGDDIDAAFGIAGAAPVPGVADGAGVRFADLRPHSDLVVTAIPSGITESIVLKSASAPTSWRFPLRLTGLTPELVEAAGRVDLRDRTGKVRMVIPPGFMYDAVRDPRTGTGTRSNGVRYTVDKDGGTWILGVTLDEAWLRSPARRYPVVVDPPLSLRDSIYADTFVSSTVFANRDNSRETFLKVGTFNGGGEKSASYIRFHDSPFLFRFVLGASLNLYQTWARSCTPSTLYVHRTTSDWFEFNALSWPGPSYDGTPIAQKAFSRGGNCTSNPAGWETIPLNPTQLTSFWNLSVPFFGFSLRASNTDNNGEKYFYSSQYAGGGGPTLDVLYSDVGAVYSLPNPRFSPPVTPSTSGLLDVRVQNLGLGMWPANGGYSLVAETLNSEGLLADYSIHFVNHDTQNRMTETFTIWVGPLPAGTYTLHLTMQDSMSRPFDGEFGVPGAYVSFQVLPSATPEVTGIYPPNNAHVDTLRPSLWGQYFDADNAPAGPSYWFRACSGAATPVCVDTGWISSATWTVPAGLYTWGTTATWYVAVGDGASNSFLTGPYGITPTVAQPAVTHHLAGAPDGSDVPDLNVHVGNYATTVTDASVAVSGPPLEIRRTYNSQDPRSTGAFGSGWTTPLDQKVTTDPDGSGNVVVTLESGRQVRFGKNADGSFAPPPGHTMTLVRGTGIWTLQDPTGQKRVYDDAGKLTTLIDAYGRQQQYLYTGSQVTQVKDVASTRSLYLTWTSGRVTTVKTDAPTAGAAQPTWTYTYSGTRLTRVCSPLSAASCVDYGWVSSSHYRSVVSDDNPIAYWPLSETTGSVATNVVARTPGEFAATYSAATLNQADALGGTSDPAISLAGNGALLLPDNTVASSLTFAVELWFKAASGNTGVLFGEQNTPLGVDPWHFSPGLYVGTDGKLHGKFWNGSTTGQAISAARVDNAAWHHAVISVNVDRQDVYLDGALIGTVTGGPILHLDMAKTMVGNGFAGTWPNAPTGSFPFTGQIDEVAVYRHPLGASQVSAHWAARLATSRLTKVTEPGAFVAVQATYDGATGRIATLRDRQGALWTLTQPAVGDGTRAVTLSATGRDAITYTYDARRGDRLISRRTGVGTEKWEYDANGFISKYTDANNRDRLIYHDARGNITWEAVFRQGGWVWKNHGYHLNTADKLDPRNDRMVWQSGTRNAWDNDASNRIRYDLDAAGRVTRIQYPWVSGSPAFAVELFAYTAGTEAAVGGGTVPAGLIKTSTNKAGGTTSYEYDSRGDLVRTTDPLGLITSYGYDLLGRNTSRATSTLFNGLPLKYGFWTLGYNAASLLTTQNAPSTVNPITGVTHSAVTTNTYDANGRIIQRSVADTTGGDATRTTVLGYDPAGRLRSTTTPDNAVTTQEWTTAGDLAAVVKPNGLRLEYRYDDFRHLVETTAVGPGVDPDNPTATRLVLESRAYDPAGQLASVTDAMGRETGYTYHNDGLLETTKRVRRNAAGDITSTTLLAQYEYDYGGNLIRETGPNGVLRDFDYDESGNPVRETLDPAGLARTTVRTFNMDGAVLSTRERHGFSLVTGRTAEAAYLFANSGSQLDGGGARYADGTNSWTYRFVFPPNATAAQLNLEVSNQYKLQLSRDNVGWGDVLNETRDIRDGSNRVHWTIGIDAWVALSKTIYVRLSDSQPATGWGARVQRFSVEYTKANEPDRRISYQTDFHGNVVKETVDNAGGTPAALVTTIARDARGLVTQHVDPAGAATAFSYDAAGQQVTRTGAPRTVWRDGVQATAVSPVTTTGYNTFGDATGVRDAYGAVTTTGYDAMSRPIRVTKPAYTPPGGTALTPVTTTDYNLAGRPTAVTDPLGRTTSYTYDLYGRLTERADPDPDGGGATPVPRWRFAYDRDGEQVSATDPTGAVTLATYNDLGHQVTDTAAERIGTGTVYYTNTIGRDDRGRMTSLTTPLNHTTTFEYNAADEQTKVTDPVGRTVEKRYDNVGRVTAEITAGARATSRRYDVAGRETVTADHTVAGGVLSAPLRSTTRSYDPMGRPLSVSSAQGRLTQYAYDGAGQLSAVTERTNPADPATAVTVSLGYDSLGNRSRLVDGRGNATDYVYNGWDLLTEVRDPGTGPVADRTFTTVYDAAGQPVGDRLPGGVSRTRTYDGLGRLTAETGTGAGQPTIGRGLDYDAVGRTTTVSSPAGDYTYTYNDRGLLTRSTRSGSTSTFTYDGEDNLTARSDPSGSGTFTYDAAGRLATATDALTGATATFSYAATGDLSGIGYGTSRPTRTYGYDNLGRLSSDTMRSSTGATTLSTSYGYDLDDNVTSRVTTGYSGGGSNTYGYDGLNRLTSWTRPDAQVVTYTYDGASNRTSTTGPGGTRTFGYDTRNRMTSATGGGLPDVTNTWTARGTLATTRVGTSTTTYGTDAFDKPTTVSAPGYTVTYTYDALDRLAQRNGTALAYPDLSNNASSVPTSGGQALVYRDPDGSPLSDRIGTGAGRLAVTDRLHGDAVGAVGGVDGEVLASRSYGPYGETQSSTGQFPLGFQGGWSDPDTAQVNALARWYDPALASFTGRDSYNLDPTSVPAPNRYAYGNGNPIRNADPSGHCPVCAIPIGEALIWLGAAIIAYFAVDWWVDSGAAGEVIGQLYGLGDAAVTNYIDALHELGVSAQEIIDRVRVRFATHSAVIDIVGPPPVRIPPSTTAPSTTPPPASPPAALPAPPIQQTITNILSPIVPLLPAGQLLENSLPATATALVLPQLVLNDSDGSDAANTVVQGAIAAEAVRELGGTGDPNCDDRDAIGDWLVNVVEDAAAEVMAQGLAGFPLTEPMQGRLDEMRATNDPKVEADADKLERIFRGNRFHIAVRDLLRLWYPGQFGYRSGGKNNDGPDFPHFGSGRDVELTTPGERGRHLDRGDKYDPCLFAFYTMPTE